MVITLVYTILTNIKLITKINVEFFSLGMIRVSSVAKP